MKPGERISIAAALAAPFVIFLAALLLSPPLAGTIAGTVLGRIFDPIMLVAIIGGVIIGATGRKWWFAPIFALLPAAVGVTMAFRWWVDVAGEAQANRQAVLFALWAVGLATYGLLAGKIFR